MRGRTPILELRGDAARRLWRVARVLGALAVLLLAGVVTVVLLVADGAEPVDFHSYLAAAHQVRDGESIYPGFSYPPLTIYAALPFTYLSLAAAELLVKVLLIACLGATLLVAGVRDWRCYALALVWPPSIAAVQTGNVTLVLALACALAWRYRDRAPVAGIAVGASVAAKFILWPLTAWLVAINRSAAAVWSAIATAVFLMGSFAVLGWSTILDYPDALRGYPEAALEGYSLDVLLEDLGLGPTIARVAMIALAGSLLLAAIVVGRRGDEKRSFVLTIGAVLAWSPFVWLHYFALLLVPVAVVRPRLDRLWFVPLLMWGSAAGTGNGSTGGAVVVVVVVSLTLAFAYRAADGRPDDRRAATPRARRAALAGSR